MKQIIEDTEFGGWISNAVKTVKKHKATTIVGAFIVVLLVVAMFAM